jgi:hypothetical protein
VCVGDFYRGLKNHKNLEMQKCKVGNVSFVFLHRKRRVICKKCKVATLDFLFFRLCRFFRKLSIEKYFYIESLEKILKM